MTLRNRLTHFLRYCVVGADDELPRNYRRVDYIQGDGDLYYDTGEKLYGSDTITLTLSGTSSAGQNIIGAYAGTTEGIYNFSLFIYGAGSSSNSYYRHGMGTNASDLMRPRYGTGKRTITLTATGTTGFLTDASSPDSTQEFTTTSDCWIFALPNSSSAKFTGRINGNIEIGNRLKYIPCERVSDGAVGYYEVYTKKFLEPQDGTPTYGEYDNSHLRS